ncbi:MAG: hypothetical protein IIY65_01185 [Erysipelotrichaceae bacterium]|nr:hypothetical protein [Erysipelotrichaceae bacterium]
MKKLLMVLLAVLLLSACSEKGPVVEGFVGRNVEDVYAWCSEIDPKYSCEVSYGGNDEYEKDIVYEQSINAGKRLEDKISFKVSLGKAKEIVLPYITEDVTLSDIEVWKEAVGMENVKYVYETNDKIEKNHIIRMEPVTGVHKDTPITVYVSSGPAEPEQTTHEVVFGDYIGITVEEFEAAAKKLGLKPNHQESRDRYNPDVKFGNIAWHGSGVYEKDEVFNYGVCINAITVSPGQYVGKSEDEFIKIAKGLHLNPTRIAGRDAYSASIPKGYIVTHGNGVYVENEDFKYGVSYGPATVRTGYEGVTEDVFTEYLDMLELKGDRKTRYSDSVSAGRIITYNHGNYSSGDVVTYYVSLGPEAKKVNVPDFAGRSEDELLRFLSNNGILVAARFEKESDYPKGTVTYNDKGDMTPGTKITYTVSAGQQKETAVIESFETIYDHVTHEGDYEHARFDMHRYLFGRGFMNYEIIPVAYKDYEPGILLIIYVNGEEHTYAESVPLDAYVQVYISSEVE